MFFITKEKIVKKTLHDQIFEEWKRKWTSDDTYNETKDYFYKLVLDTYPFLKKKIEKNRTMNFRIKYTFLALIFLLLISLIVSILIEIFVLHYEWKDIALNSVVVILFVLLLNIISKLIDIKKYQETWVRHEDHKFSLDREMLKFVQELDPYSSTTPHSKEVFMQNVMKIWQKNQDKFVSNMEQKEQTIGDFPNPLK